MDKNKTSKKQIIMKKFTPLAMKCSQKDWDSIKVRLEGKYEYIDSFDECKYLTNIFTGEKNCVSNISKKDKFGIGLCEEIHETFNAKIFLNACGIDCDVYEITKEQVLEISKRCTGYEFAMKYAFPEAFKKELEVGKWYKNLDKGYEKSICCVIEVNKEDKDCFSGYGIDYIGEYFYESIDTTFCGSNNWQEATTQEIEAALICEAKKRGAIIGGQCNWGGGKIDIHFFKFDDGVLYVNKDEIIMDREGKWASIIETITIQEAEKLLNKKIV